MPLWFLVRMEKMNLETLSESQRALVGPSLSGWGKEGTGIDLYRLMGEK